MDNGREFSDAGAEWWEGIIQELAYELDSACPGTERFLPKTWETSPSYRPC